MLCSASFFNKAWLLSPPVGRCFSSLSFPSPLLSSTLGCLQYQVAQLYMVAKSSAEETAVTAGEGVAIHKNEPYTEDNNPYGLPLGGQYTHKTLFFASRLPRWALSILPTAATSLTERSWNAYPLCVTQYTNDYLGESLHLTVTSAHAADRGEQPNATGLGPEDLAVRQVDYINIACGADADAAAVRTFVPGSGGSGRLGGKDPTAVAAVASRGPLSPRWFAEGAGGGVCMCAYKVRGVDWSGVSWGAGADVFARLRGGAREGAGWGAVWRPCLSFFWAARALEVGCVDCDEVHPTDDWCARPEWFAFSCVSGHEGGQAAGEGIWLADSRGVVGPRLWLSCRVRHLPPATVVLVGRVVGHVCGGRAGHGRGDTAAKCGGDGGRVRWWARVARWETRGWG